MKKIIVLFLMGIAINSKAQDSCFLCQRSGIGTIDYNHLTNTECDGELKTTEIWSDWKSLSLKEKPHTDDSCWIVDNKLRRDYSESNIGNLVYCPCSCPTVMKYIQNKISITTGEIQYRVKRVETKWVGHPRSRYQQVMDSFYPSVISYDTILSLNNKGDILTFDPINPAPIVHIMASYGNPIWTSSCIYPHHKPKYKHSKKKKYVGQRSK